MPSLRYAERGKASISSELISLRPHTSPYRPKSPHTSWLLDLLSVICSAIHRLYVSIEVSIATTIFPRLQLASAEPPIAPPLEKNIE